MENACNVIQVLELRLPEMETVSAALTSTIHSFALFLFFRQLLQQFFLCCLCSVSVKVLCQRSSRCKSSSCVNVLLTLLQSAFATCRDYESDIIGTRCDPGTLLLPLLVLFGVVLIFVSLVVFVN